MNRMVRYDAKYRWERSEFPELFNELNKRNFRIIGPKIRDSAIVYDQIYSEADLPIGWTDVQEAGNYRLKRREDQAIFGYNAGPDSMKKFLHPPRQLLWDAKRGKDGFEISPKDVPREKRAYLGIRACGLQAVTIQDSVFTEGVYVNESYRKKREDAFIIAVNCSQAGKTCFCASMGSGPCAKKGFDVALTEVLRKNEHYFLIETGTKEGLDIVSNLSVSEATNSDIQIVDEILEKTAMSMGRTMDTANIKSLLYENLESSRWEDVASRCLSCANCTMVCPTCFCTTVQDKTDLSGEIAERWERWDSCFNLEFTEIHGGSSRSSTKSLYRQWLTHKLATWMDQFGTSGCVGCGRCITWCPVGIDITEEVKAIRESDNGN